MSCPLLAEASIPLGSCRRRPAAPGWVRQSPPDCLSICRPVKRRSRAAIPVQRLLLSIERFLSVEASSGLVLVFGAVVGLVWANSPWRHGYEAMLRLPLGFRGGPMSFNRDLQFWLNE